MSGPHGWKTTSVTPLLAELVDPGLDLVGGAGDGRRRQQRPAGRRPRRPVGVVEVDAVADVDVEVALVLGGARRSTASHSLPPGRSGTASRPYSS